MPRFLPPRRTGVLVPVVRRPPLVPKGRPGRRRVTVPGTGGKISKRVGGMEGGAVGAGVGV